MEGKNAGVIALIRIKKPFVVDLGCVAHLTSLCNLYAAKALPFQVVDLITDIYYHFEKRYQVKSFISINVLLLVISSIFISTQNELKH